MASLSDQAPAADRVKFDECDELLTVEDMAQLFKTSCVQVRRFCASGQLPAVHIGRRWYCHRRKLAEMFGL